MKVLVLSDVHANIWALRAVMEEEKEYHLMLFAGDLVDYGIAPAETIRWFQSAPDKVLVRGNHDAHAVRVRDTEDWNHMPSHRYKWIHYNLQRMSPEQVTYLEQMPEYNTAQADGWAYLITHSYGGSYQTIESSAQFEEFWRAHTPKAMQDAPRRRIVFGHTHRQGLHLLEDGMEWLNPGSLSYRRPDDPDKTAHYAVIQDGQVRLKRIPYDRTPQRDEALRILREEGMMETELQDFMFFFGSSPSSRSPLPKNI